MVLPPTRKWLILESPTGDMPELVRGRRRKKKEDIIPEIDRSRYKEEKNDMKITY